MGGAHLECEYCLAPSMPGDVFTGDKPTAEADASPNSSVRSKVEYAAEVSCGGGIEEFGGGGKRVV